MRKAPSNRVKVFPHFCDYSYVLEWFAQRNIVHVKNIRSRTKC